MNAEIICTAVITTLEDELKGFEKLWFTNPDERQRVASKVIAAVTESIREEIKMTAGFLDRLGRHVHKTYHHESMIAYEICITASCQSFRESVSEIIQQLPPEPIPTPATSNAPAPLS